MSMLPTCLLYTQDEDLNHRLHAYLASVAKLQSIKTSGKLSQALKQNGSHVLLMDLRGDEAQDLLPQIRKSWPDLVVIAIGEPRSEPMRTAEVLGVYAGEDIVADRRRIQAVVTRAVEHWHLLEENKGLREERHRALLPERRVLGGGPERLSTALPLQHFSRAFRSFEDVNELLPHMAEAVANSAMVSKVGIYATQRSGDIYTLRANVKCAPETIDATYGSDDALVHWLTANSQVVARSTLEYVENRADRTMLRNTLDSLGAEVLLPLQGRGRLLGWIILGSRVTGMPFELPDLEDFMVVADHVSATLDNALLHEEVTVQKAMAETLLQSMPTGIVAVDENASIRWFNSASEEILGLAADDVLFQPVESLGSRITDLMHRTLEGELPYEPTEWYDQERQRYICVHTCRLQSRKTCLGALALVQDTTNEKIMREKQDGLERAAFWAELAASMSHEVRNPLVAIKTFAQLLPERYEDAEFREEFSTLVDQEVGRLNKMIDQINHFAHPPELAFQTLDVGITVKTAVNMALMDHPSQAVNVEVAIPDNLPDIRGDDGTLTECFVHLIGNALEAIQKQKGGRVSVVAKSVFDDHDNTRVEVRIEDTGKGIPRSMLEKVYSPFSTSKARGMGLGMPIAKRTLVDHRGELHIETGSSGTCVTVTLPIEKKEEYHETYTHS